MPREDLRPRSDLGLLLTATLLTQAALFMCRPMTSYRIMDVGGSAAHVGLVAACFSLLPLLVAMPIGRLVDEDHGVLLVRLGIGTGAAAAVLLATADNLWLITAANVLLGLGHLLNVVSAQGLLSRSTALARQDRLFGAFTVAASAGQLIGPPLAALAADDRGMRHGGAATAVLLAAALSAMSLVLVTRVRGNRPPAPRTGPRHPAPDRYSPAPDRRLPAPRSSRTLLAKRGMAPAILASLSLLASVDLLTSFLPVLAVERGISVTAVGWLLALRAAASMAARLLVHRALAFVQRRTLLALSMGVAGVLLVSLPWLPELWLVALLLAVAGFFLGVGQPLTMTWVVMLAGDDARATALALRLAGNRLGQVSVPGLAAVVAGASGATGVFWLLGGVLTLSLVPVLQTSNPD